LLFLVPCDAKDVVKEYKILVNELKLYNPELLKKDRVLGISKCDLMDAELMNEFQKDMKKKFKEKKVPLVYFSSHTHKGLSELKDVLWKQINK
jgi:GTP-binding protein